MSLHTLNALFMQLLIMRMLVVAVLVATCNFRGAADQPIRVISVNIQADDAGKKDWKKRKPVLWKILNEQKADFVCLQEAMPKQIIQTICHLKQNRLSYHQVGYGRPSNGVTSFPMIDKLVEKGDCETNFNEGGEHCQILFRDDQWTCLKWGTLWLTPEVGQRQIPGTKAKGAKHPRIFTWASFINQKTKYELLIVNTHLDNASGSEGSSIRSQAVSQIVSFVDTIRRDLPVLFVGDMNATPNASEIATALKSGMTRLDDDSATFHDFRPSGGTQKLDYIFWRGNPPVKKHFQVLNTLGQHSIGAQWPSDHFPLQIEWQP